jgi:hypothetical protein
MTSPVIPRYFPVLPVIFGRLPAFALISLQILLETLFSPVINRRGRNQRTHQVRCKRQRNVPDELQIHMIGTVASLFLWLEAGSVG